VLSVAIYRVCIYMLYMLRQMDSECNIFSTRSRTVMKEGQTYRKKDRQTDRQTR